LSIVIDFDSWAACYRGFVGWIFHFSAGVATGAFVVGFFMLKIAFGLLGDGRVVRVEAAGHAESAAYGEDLVCAAASVLLQSLWLGLTQVVGIVVEGGWTSGDLRMSIADTDAARIDVAALMQTALRSLEALAHEHPKNVRVSSQLQ
jgi:uncharacterized protein YsxB (DUF464 family)